MTADSMTSEDAATAASGEMNSSDRRTAGHAEIEPARRLAGDRLAYRPSELAALVGMSTKAIYRAIDRGELRAARVSNGTRLLVPALEARAWLSENLVEPRVAEQPPRLPRRVRRKSGELRPLAAVFEELDLGRVSGYDRRAT